MTCRQCHGFGTLDDCSGHEIPCLDCDGEGTVYEAVPGGRWNGNCWEPDERPVPCERCSGLGTLALEDLTETELDRLGITLEDVA